MTSTTTMTSYTINLANAAGSGHPGQFGFISLNRTNNGPLCQQNANGSDRADSGASDRIDFDDPDDTDSGASERTNFDNLSGINSDASERTNFGDPDDSDSGASKCTNFDDLSGTDGDASERTNFVNSGNASDHIFNGIDGTGSYADDFSLLADSFQAITWQAEYAA